MLLTQLHIYYSRRGGCLSHRAVDVVSTPSFTVVERPCVLHLHRLLVNCSSAAASRIRGFLAGYYVAEEALFWTIMS